MNQPKKNKLLIGCGVVAGLFVFTIIAIMMAAGVAIQTGYIASSAVVRGSELKNRQRQEIYDVIGRRSGESILYFYSAALKAADDGNLFTNQRVVSYNVVDGELFLFEANLEDVTSIEFNRSDSWVEDSTITIESATGDAFYLLVSSEDDLDLEFHSTLTEYVNHHRDQSAGP